MKLLKIYLRNKNMRNILIIPFFLHTLVCYAQESETVKKMLEERYGIGTVTYNSEEGGWYEIKKEYSRAACDLTGKEIVPLQEEVFIHKIKSDNLYFYELHKSDKKALYNQYGDCIIPMLANTAKLFIEYDGSIIAVKQGANDPLDIKEQRLGLYNKKGKFLLPREYTFLVLFNTDGIYLVGKGGKSNTLMGYWDYPHNAKYALYDVNREMFTTDFVYDYIDHQYKRKEKLASFNIGGKIIENTNNYNAIVRGGKWGYLGEDGKEVIPAKYESATPFKEGVAQVTENGIATLIPNPLTKGNSYARTEVAIALDTQIPETKKKGDDTFAFILSNENYSNFSSSDYSINDGKIFAEYCKKTLGIPENNVRYYEDATYGNIQKAIKQVKDIADVYDGEAKIIFYFSGLGISDEKTSFKYLLPSDASLSALSSTAISLEQLCQTLSKLKTLYTLTIIDAPFNGADKNGKALASGRGAKISNKSISEPKNNMILVLGSETGNCYSSKTLGHGLLTYSILNHINKSSGNSDIKSLFDAAFSNVRKESLNLFKDVQKPEIKVSEQIKNALQTLKM